MEVKAGRIMAINHDRKEMASVGNTRWDVEPTETIEEKLRRFAPNMEDARKKYFDHIERFKVQELMVQSEANKLGYKRVPSYWNTH